VTLLLSAFPEMTTATRAILLQANEIVVEPMDLAALVDVIKRRVGTGLNLASLDFSVLLIGVMTTADEIDSQLSQATVAYVEESVKDALPA
jgi:hypothetical protein